VRSSSIEGTDKTLHHSSKPHFVCAGRSSGHLSLSLELSY